MRADGRKQTSGATELWRLVISSTRTALLTIAPVVRSDGFRFLQP